MWRPQLQWLGCDWMYIEQFWVSRYSVWRYSVCRPFCHVAQKDRVMIFLLGISWSSDPRSGISDFSSGIYNSLLEKKITLCFYSQEFVKASSSNTIVLLWVIRLLRRSIPAEACVFLCSLQHVCVTFRRNQQFNHVTGCDHGWKRNCQLYHSELPLRSDQSSDNVGLLWTREAPWHHVTTVLEATAPAFFCSNFISHLTPCGLTIRQVVNRAVFGHAMIKRWGV